MKKKILICGATGFIGRNIAERFAQKPSFEVTGTYLKSQPLEDTNIEMIHTDLTDGREVEKIVKGQDIIIQAAASTSGSGESADKPYIHIPDNNVMNSWILKSILNNKIEHFIFPSCSIVYGSSDKPLREEDYDENKILPKYFIGAKLKLGIEDMCKGYSKYGETKYTLMRHSNIYGPYDKFDLEKSHVFGATVNKIVNAKQGGEIMVWGDGKEERDLLYVDDLVNFVEAAIERQESKYEIYNVGFGKGISITNLVKKMIEVSKRQDLKIKYDTSKPTIKVNICLDSEKARTTLGWKPGVSLDEGIKRTIKLYKENKIKGV